MTEDTCSESTARALRTGLAALLIAAITISSFFLVMVYADSSDSGEVAQNAAGNDSVPSLVSWSSGEIHVTKVRVGGELITEKFILPIDLQIEDLVVQSGLEPIAVRCLDNDWNLSEVSQGFLIDSYWLIDGSGIVFVPVDVDYLIDGSDVNLDDIIITVVWILEIVVVQEFKTVKEVVLE